MLDEPNSGWTVTSQGRGLDSNPFRCGNTELKTVEEFLILVSLLQSAFVRDSYEGTYSLESILAVTPPALPILLTASLDPRFSNLSQEHRLLAALMLSKVNENQSARVVAPGMWDILPALKAQLSDDFCLLRQLYALTGDQSSEQSAGMFEPIMHQQNPSIVS